jgi:hypothetical protein
MYSKGGPLKSHPMNNEKSSVVARARFASLVLCCAVLSVPLDFICAAYAQARWDAPHFKQAGSDLASWNCSAAWNAIWPLAKRGDHDARLFLYSAMVYHLQPPGLHSSLSRHSHTQHMLTFAAHGALAPPERSDRKTIHDAVRKDIPAMIEQLKLGAEGGRAAQCYKLGGSFESCLTLAISLGVVQTFGEYAHDVDVLARESDSSATCYRPH